MIFYLSAIGVTDQKSIKKWTLHIPIPCMYSSIWTTSSVIIITDIESDNGVTFEENIQLVVFFYITSFGTFSRTHFDSD